MIQSIAENHEIFSAGVAFNITNHFAREWFGDELFAVETIRFNQVVNFHFLTDSE